MPCWTDDEGRGGFDQALRAEVLRYPCSRCLATPGNDCHSPSGRKVAPHQGRRAGPFKPTPDDLRVIERGRQ